MKPITIEPFTLVNAPWDLLLLADPSKALVSSYISRGRGYRAFIENETVGAFVLLETHPGIVELMNIAVSESYQGRGIGKILVSEAIIQASAMGAHQIDVGTGNSGTGQLAFYQKCGFRIVGVDPDFFVRNYPEEIWENGIQCRDMVRLSRAIP